MCPKPASGWLVSKTTTSTAVLLSATYPALCVDMLFSFRLSHRNYAVLDLLCHDVNLFVSPNRESVFSHFQTLCPCDQHHHVFFTSTAGNLSDPSRHSALDVCIMWEGDAVKPPWAGNRFLARLETGASAELV